MHPRFRFAIFSTLLLATLSFSSAAYAGGRPSGGHPTGAPHPYFVDILHAANQLAHSKYPTAQLLEGDGQPANGRGYTSQDVIYWRFVYNVPKVAGCHTNGTVIVQYAAGTFAGPSFTCRPFLEDLPIATPLKRTLTQAINLLHRAGYTSYFSYVTLRHPLGPDNEFPEPYFIFNMPTIHHFVWVGINSGKVFIHA